MSKQYDSTMAHVVGLWQETETMRVDFSETAVTSGLLENSYYRIIGTEDFHASQISPSSGVAATTSAPLGLQGQEYFIATDKTHTSLTVIRRNNSGALYVTRMDPGPEFLRSRNRGSQQ